MLRRQSWRVRRIHADLRTIARLTLRGGRLTTSSQTTSPNLDPARWLEDHGDVLYRLAYRAVLDRAQAEDLVQDTLLQGMLHLARFGGRSSLRTWLVTILNNRVIDYVRRCARQAKLSPVGILARPKGPLEPGDGLVNLELQLELRRCIDELPTMDREMFVLSEVEGWKHADLAEKFQISCVNVRVRLHRARLRLRDNLTGRGFGL